VVPILPFFLFIGFPFYRFPFYRFPFLPVSHFTVSFFTGFPFYRFPFLPFPNLPLPNLPFPFLPFPFTLPGPLAGKSSISELHFFLNITTVIDNIIIKKGINYLLSDGKSTRYHPKCVLRSFAEHKHQATFPETDTEVLIRNFFPLATWN